MQRRTAWRLALVLGPVYLLAAWWPFDTGRSRFLSNGARLESGQLLFTQPGLARIAAPDWLRELVNEGSLRIDLTAVPANESQRGPARILSIGRDTESQNLVLGQSESDLVLRCRRPSSDELGRPELLTPAALRTGRPLHIQVAIDPGRVTLSADGDIVATLTATDPLSAWDVRHQLTLGNEVGGNRPWLGAITEAVLTIGSSGHVIDLLEPDVLEVPTEYRIDRSHADRDDKYAFPTRGLLVDILLNILGFLPLGWLVAIGARRRAVRSAILIGLLLSAAMEFGQTIFVTRTPDLVDVASNTLGAALGAMLARRRRTAPAPPS
jgi:hypothetical protein